MNFRTKNGIIYLKNFYVSLLKEFESSVKLKGVYDGAGTYLRKDLFLQLLPVFSAGRYIKYNSNWTERGRIMKSADMKDKYLKDLESGKLNIFLLKNLL